MDIANLLNSYLMFSPKLVEHVTFDIDKFVKEDTKFVEEIVEYCEVFY